MKYQRLGFDHVSGGSEPQQLEAAQGECDEEDITILLALRLDGVESLLEQQQVRFESLEKYAAEKSEACEPQPSAAVEHNADVPLVTVIQETEATGSEDDDPEDY